jgi:hypothetical protein
LSGRWCLGRVVILAATASTEYEKRKNYSRYANLSPQHGEKTSAKASTPPSLAVVESTHERAKGFGHHTIVTSSTFAALASALSRSLHVAVDPQPARRVHGGCIN